MKKLKRLLLRRRPNSGFTLVEVIISCALLGILVLGITVFITPILQAAASTEKNARASLLAETIDAHITRSIRSSMFCVVMENVLPADTANLTNRDSVKEMIKFLEEGNNKDVYELRCLSIKYEDCVQTHEYKYKLYSETFDPTTKKLKTGTDASYPVFEDCFYDGLYPTVKIENISAVIGGESSVPSSSTSSDDEEGDTPTALKLTYQVFAKPDMENDLVFSGIGYADFIQIRTKSVNPKGTYKLFANETINSPIPGQNYSTYIFYVARRLKAAAGGST